MDDRDPVARLEVDPDVADRLAVSRLDVDGLADIAGRQMHGFEDIERAEAAYRKLGFSEPAANSYARMTEVSLDGGFDYDGRAIRGATTLDEYVRQLVARS